MGARHTAGAPTHEGVTTCWNEGRLSKRYDEPTGFNTGDGRTRNNHTGVGSGPPSAPHTNRGVGSGRRAPSHPRRGVSHGASASWAGRLVVRRAPQLHLSVRIKTKAWKWRSIKPSKRATSSNKTKGSRSNESTTRWTKRGAAERSRSSRVELAQAAPQILVGSGRAQFWSSRVVPGCRVTAGAQHENCDSGSYGCRIEVP